MKRLCPNYSIDGANVTIHAAFPFGKEAILLITDADRNEILYNFADPTRGGTLVGNTLTLDYAGSMDANTRLQIYCDDGAAPANSDLQTELRDLTDALYGLVASLSFLAGARGTAADVRVYMTNGTLTTCSTVTSLSNLGSISAATAVKDLDNTLFTLGNLNYISL